jgi:hypothetical protein
MQGRIKGLIIFLVLLALAGWILALRGCHQTVVMDITKDNGDGAVGNGPEAHPAIKKGMVLIWTYRQQFWIQFDRPSDNPCVPPSDGSTTYQAQQDPDTKQFSVTCNINGTPPKRKFQYAITFTAPSQGAPTTRPTQEQPALPPPPFSSGHCYGCSADGD